VSDLSPLKDMKLTMLLCGGSQLTDAGLIPLQEMSSLRHLEVIAPKITDAGLVYLKRLTDLEFLNCAGTKLTGAGLVHIEGMTRLRILHLDDTEVTDEGMVHFKGLHDLRELFLNQTRVTDAGLEHMAGLKNLALLNLTGTAVTNKGVAKLKAALPKCNIIAAVKAEEPKGSAPMAEGFIPLFNGKDLTGWIGSNGQPAAWRVFDGVLEVVPGKGPLATTENFGPNFQLHAEFNIPLYADRKGQARGNSGIFLLGSYEIQILDSYDNPQPPDSACAALYGKIGPSRNVCKPPNEWQTYDITFRSPRFDANKKVVQAGELTVVHNGVVVIDKGKFDSPTLGGSQDLATTGPIVLQDHGNAVRFRNLRIKPLDAAPTSEPKEKAGFIPLFNDKDLTGWKTHPKQPGNWRVEKGVLVGSGPTISHLYSERDDYKNFHLRAEARINDGGNSGVHFRVAFGPKFPANNPAHLFGYEAQINSTHGDVNKTGSLFMGGEGPAVSIRESPVPPGQWFTIEVIAQSNHILVKVDGKTTADFTDEKRRFTSGHIALQQHNPQTVAEFRKIEIKELPAAKSEAPRAAPESPAPRAKSDLPPEAKAAAAAFEKSCAEAREKLLAEFDTALDRVAKAKGSADQRLKLIDALKEEKKRFENRGLIPWSEPMRPYLAKYFVSTSDAESKVRRVYKSLIDAQLRAKNESMVADLRADLENLVGIRIVARWKYFLDGRFVGIHSLCSNGRIGKSDANTWFYSKGVLIFRWPNPNAPGGAWIDTLQVSADGATCAGTNNGAPGRRPKLSGVYVKDD
jgi:hypothetical protein